MCVLCVCEGLGGRGKKMKGKGGGGSRCTNVCVRACVCVSMCVDHHTHYERSLLA